VEIPANTPVIPRDEFLLEATHRFLTNILHTDWHFTDVRYLRFAPEWLCALETVKPGAETGVVRRRTEPETAEPLFTPTSQ
jgi:hypothetical protein